MDLLEPGEFFGEGCLTDQTRRKASATAVTPSHIQRIAKPRMLRLLHVQDGLSDCFIAHMLSRRRVHLILMKFKALGFIKGDGRVPLTIHQSLLGVVLHD